MTDARRPLTGLRVLVFGLGEAGAELAAAAAGAGAEVFGYDPADVDTPPGVTRLVEPTAEVDVALVMAVTAAADAPTALDQAAAHLPPGLLYADLSTAAPAIKRDLAHRAAAHGLDFADVALMNTAPGRGLGIPALVSGIGASRYAEILAPAGAPIEAIEGEAGLAQTRKLLRSVVIKGFAGLLIESMRAAEAAGLTEATWDNLVSQFSTMDEEILRRMVTGTPQHAVRRHHEMEAARDLLDDLGIEPTMTRATVAHLAEVTESSSPVLPEPRS